MLLLELLWQCFVKYSSVAFVYDVSIFYFFSFPFFVTVFVFRSYVTFAPGFANVPTSTGALVFKIIYTNCCEILCNIRFPKSTLDFQTHELQKSLTLDRLATKRNFFPLERGNWTCPTGRREWRLPQTVLSRARGKRYFLISNDAYEVCNLLEYQAMWLYRLVPIIRNNPAKMNVTLEFWIFLFIKSTSVKFSRISRVSLPFAYDWVTCLRIATVRYKMQLKICPVQQFENLWSNAGKLYYNSTHFNLHAFLCLSCCEDPDVVDTHKTRIFVS
jgi:hypothetical protein